MITHRGRIVGLEKTLGPRDVYGALGGLVTTLFGGPRTTQIIIKPGDMCVEVTASYGSYTLREGEINTSALCRKAGIVYVR